MPENLERILQGCFHPKEGRPNLQKVPVSSERAQRIELWNNTALKLSPMTMLNGLLKMRKTLCLRLKKCWHHKGNEYSGIHSKT